MSSNRMYSKEQVDEAWAFASSSTPAGGGRGRDGRGRGAHQQRYAGPTHHSTSPGVGPPLVDRSVNSSHGHGGGMSNGASFSGQAPFPKPAPRGGLAQSKWATGVYVETPVLPISVPKPAVSSSVVRVPNHSFGGTNLQNAGKSGFSIEDFDEDFQMSESDESHAQAEPLAQASTTSVQKDERDVCMMDMPIPSFDASSSEMRVLQPPNKTRDTYSNVGYHSSNDSVAGPTHNAPPLSPANSMRCQAGTSQQRQGSPDNFYVFDDDE